MNTSNRTTERGYAITRGTGRDADDHVEELDFDGTVPAKAGDTLPAKERSAEITADRARNVGMSGAETPPSRTTGENVTHDDLAPETLLHESRGTALPTDQALEITDVDDIGAGFGLDEAELARKDHPDASDRRPD